MANQNPTLLSNDFKTLNSLNRNTNTVLFSGNSDTISALVSHTTPKLTSLIYKHAYLIPSNGTIRPTVIDKSQPTESIGSRLCDHTRTSDSGVRARCNSCRTLPLVGIDDDKRHTKKGYYFCKYYKPLDPKGYYPLTYGRRE
jgi:hypothetical protein